MKAPTRSTEESREYQIEEEWVMPPVLDPTDQFIFCCAEADLPARWSVGVAKQWQLALISFASKRVHPAGVLGRAPIICDD